MAGLTPARAPYDGSADRILGPVPAVRRRLPSAPAALPAALLAILLAVLLAACDSDGSTAPAPEPSPSSTPLPDFATEGIAVARDEFCSRVAPAAVETALGADAASADSYGNGDRARLGNGPADVAHEFGCTWRAADGTTVRGWVFVPPVTPARAGRLRADAAAGPRCAVVPRAARFGSRSVAVRCRTADGVETSYHGLFGDAWLSCSLEAPGRGDPADLLDRTGRWCVSVAQAAAA